MSVPTHFTPGLSLTRRFYEQLIAPLLSGHYPQLAYAAAVVGPGSEVLGFDTAISADHDWGPRVHLFLQERDFTLAPQISALILKALPKTFEGHSTRFQDNHRVSTDVAQGRHSSDEHGVEILTVPAYAEHLLGVDISAHLDSLTWLSLPQQLLLSLTAGAVFHDGFGDLTRLRKRFAYYPDDIRTYLIACAWARISEEQAFVGRTAAVDDEPGNTILVGRIVRDIMRLCFLYEGRYAPYLKWFGSGFRRLNAFRSLSKPIEDTLQASDGTRREAALCVCYERLGEEQTRFAPDAPSVKISRYFDRPYHVCNADAQTQWFQANITDPDIAAMPPIGSIDLVSDNTLVLSRPSRCRSVMESLLGPDL